MLPFDVLIWPFITGVILMIFAAPLGSFMVWQRISFLGDTLSHLGFLGFVLSITLGMSSFVSLALIIAMSAFILALPRAQQPRDSIIMFISQSALALALVIGNGDHEILDMHMLTGELLHMTYQDAFLTFISAVIFVLILRRYWSVFLHLTLSEDFVILAGYNLFWIRFLLFSFMGYGLVLSLKMMGLLMTSVLFIGPSLLVQSSASNPFSMVKRAFCVGLCAILCGFVLHMCTGMLLSPLMTCALGGISCIWIIWHRFYAMSILKSTSAQLSHLKKQSNTCGHL